MRLVSVPLKLRHPQIEAEFIKFILFRSEPLHEELLIPRSESPLPFGLDLSLRTSHRSQFFLRGSPRDNDDGESRQLTQQPHKRAAWLLENQERR